MLKKVSFVILTVATIATIESLNGQPRAVAAPLCRVGSMETITTSDVQIAEMVELPCVISRFDNIMRKVGSEEGQDWRLMSAIAYNESRFIENLVSKQGATGIMQPPPLIHAIVPPLFFTIVLAHVAVSTPKALITLGFGNTKFIKISGIVIKVICIATLVADIVGFYLYVC